MALDVALQRWNETHGRTDDRLAIDGKTMRNAINEHGDQTHIMSVVGHQSHQCYTRQTVGSLAPQGDEQLKQTNEIKVAAPLLEAIDIRGKEITADALLTQRQFATYLVEDRQAHYHFTIKGNQPDLLRDVALHFEQRQTPDFVEGPAPEHGRIETRKIRTSTLLNDYLNFPHVGRAFLIERERIEKKTGKHSIELAYGITGRSPEQADASQVLQTNRGHRCIENSCHYIIDWNFDEDRSRIRTGRGPANITRLRRFAVGILKSKGVSNVAQKMRQLHRSTRLVFDYLRMSANTCTGTTGCA